MKLQISYNNHDIRSGFLVLEHLADHSTDLQRTKADITFLDPHVSNGECEEILINEPTLSFFPQYAIYQILDHWLSKLAIGGVITLVDYDIMEISRDLISGKLSLNDYNILVLGQQNQPWLFRKSSLHLAQISEFLENRGLNMVSKKIQDYKFCISAQRMGVEGEVK